MKNLFKRLKFWAQIILISLIFSGILLEVSGTEGNKNELGSKENTVLVIIQGNTLSSLSNPANPPPNIVRTMQAIITAYSSTPWETDDTPFITASGTFVREGIVANNYLPFGTKIRIPEIYGDKVFTVEDRMSWKKSNYHVDIWFPDYHQALTFGAERTHIEVLEM